MSVAHHTVNDNSLSLSPTDEEMGTRSFGNGLDQHGSDDCSFDLYVLLYECQTNITHELYFSLRLYVRRRIFTREYILGSQFRSGE